MQRKIIITAGCVKESRDALTMATDLASNVQLYSTVGVHPTRAKELQGNEEAVIQELNEILDAGIVSRKVLSTKWMFTSRLLID